MTWRAPDITSLLEDRLKQARMDVLADARLNTRESFGFSSQATTQTLLELIEGRIAAAADSGFAAVQASLRLDASRHLQSRQVPLNAAREVLEEADRTLTPPALPPRPQCEDLRLSPTVLSALVFVAWTLVALLLWLPLRFPPLVLAVLVALGGIPATIAKNQIESQRFSAQASRLREYPPLLCRHYVEALRHAIKLHERCVNSTPGDLVSKASQRQEEQHELPSGL